MSLSLVHNARDRITIDFADLGIEEVVMLGRYNYSRAHPPLKPHMHKNIFEICLLERGAQTYVIGSACYNLTGGDLFITKPDEIHGTGLAPESKGRLYWLEIRQIPSGQTFLGLTPQESNGMMRCFTNIHTRHFRNGDHLVPTFERILAAYADRQNPMRAADLRNLLLRLVLDILVIVERRAAHPYSPGIQKAIRHIEQNPGILPGINELAQIAGMSASYFKVLFKRETGMPPVEYAMWRRMEKAKHLLRSSGISITRLSMDLGFSTSQHFATVFKRLTGHTPKTFRQRSRLPSPHEAPSSGAGPRFHPAQS